MPLIRILPRKFTLKLDNHPDIGPPQHVSKMFHLLIHIPMHNRADYTSHEVCTPKGWYLCEYLDPEFFRLFVEADTVSWLV